MGHGVVDLFAYQEGLLVMAVFGLTILAMAWFGFRRWLQHKETMGRLNAAQHDAQMEHVEHRLKAVEKVVADVLEPQAQIDTPRGNALPDPISTGGDVRSSS